VKSQDVTLSVCVVLKRNPSVRMHAAVFTLLQQPQFWVTASYCTAPNIQTGKVSYTLINVHLAPPDRLPREAKFLNSDSS